MKISLNNILNGIPPGLRDPLFKEYSKILKNYRERRWEPAELNGGKLCEIVYSIIKGHVDSSFPSKPSKPQNMYDACKKMEAVDKQYSRAIRIQIPRILIALYEIRNNRGIGHVGGDIDPNYMDATIVLGMCKWLMAELIRVFHDIDPESASKTVELITERTIPIIWEIDGKRRVLDHKLSKKEQTLLLLYSTPVGISEKELCDWIEHSNISAYKKILKILHKERYIEFDLKQKHISISPKGVRFVEEKLNLDFSYD